jgi:hypothetical protein
MRASHRNNVEYIFEEQSERNPSIIVLSDVDMELK